MDMIVAGNDFLADWFQQYNENVVILPTAVDTQRFRPAPRPYSGSGHSLIGWSGTSSNLPYLYAIEPALGRVLQEFPEAHLRVVCDRAPHFAQLSGEQVEFIRWTPEIEVRSIQEMTIGIMPLESTDWARGKCSYKMLLYMACGVPVVASPVGMNAQVLAEDTVGVGATTQQGWAEALLFLLAQPDERQQMGKNGRLLVEQRYSVAVLAPLMASYLKGVT
jgi:glycosyltransferase involved in cell wall biosynthesis